MVAAADLKASPDIWVYFATKCSLHHLNFATHGGKPEIAEIIGHDDDEAVRPFMHVEFFAGIWSRPIKHPQLHHQAMDVKAMEKSACRLAPEYLLGVPTEVQKLLPT
jgi:hypothetical protein